MQLLNQHGPSCPLAEVKTVVNFDTADVVENREVGSASELHMMD